MRALVISDIHGNAAALEAVAAEPRDLVICLGDIVGYGPEPAWCVDWVREHAQVVVQGNHDRAAAEGIDPRCSNRFRTLAQAASGFAQRQLSSDARDFLARLPRWAGLPLDEVEYLFVHATPSEPRYRYLGPDAAEWAHEIATVQTEVVVVGHTHLPFSIPVAGSRVVNPGSVGQPKDGDPRAAYAVIDGGRIELKRVAYAVERTVGLLEASDIGPDAICQLSELLRTGSVPAVAPDSTGSDRAG